MNILYTITRYWPAIGGAETHVRQIATELSNEHGVHVIAHSMDQRVDPVYVSTVGTPAEDQTYMDGSATVHIPGITAIERLRLRPASRLYHYPLTKRTSYRFYASVFATKMEQLIREHQIDIVHNVLVGTELLSQCSLEIAHKLGLPFVITPLVHEGIWGDSEYCFEIYRKADAVVALLDVERRLYLNNGVPESRSHIVGVSPVIAETFDAEAFRAHHHIGGRIVLFVGRQVRSKGYAELLEAAPLVWQQHPDVSFIFVGPSEEAEYSVDHDGDKRILRLGPLSDSEKSSALAACDIFCLPSVSEIMPTAILEAWQFGKPVIGGDIPALRELIEDKGAGLNVAQNPEAIAQSLIGLLDDPDYARQLGEQGKARVEEHYTTRRVASRLEELYGELCGRNLGQHS
ncbi:MAG: glycosyltransferase family 4 protein [Candidatus Latescibacteria bacterium]|jgi:phosphatidyl-myo-inositol dimannoside synthase|nr:glycosyltransferase family 4 protein [Candidatus Latescibacterota bacterium]